MSPAGGPPSRSGPRAATRNEARKRVDLPRLVAWRLLRAVQEEDAYANLVLPGLLRQAGLTGRDAAFTTELGYGTLRLRGRHDAVLGRCVDRPLTDLDPALLDALRLGVHQLTAMRVAEHAAVAATVDLVRSEVGQGAAGLANAVLRRVAGRDLDSWLAEVAPDTQDPLDRLATTTSHPAWVVRALRDALVLQGRDAGELADLLAADNLAPPVTLAALPGLCEPAELLDGGAAAGYWSPFAVTMTGAPDGVRAVRQGRARVQDEGSQLVARALADAPLTGPDGGRWLDLCAGPGGKAALLAAIAGRRVQAGELPADARLTAVEPAEHRAALVSGSVRPLAGLVQVRVGDGREVAEQDADHYDRVLVDAPCTGLGALRRRPESRWRRTPADLAALGSLQRALLTAALAAVRPGGVVAYVTCSPHPAETLFVLQDVLRKHPQVQRLDARPLLPGVAELGEGPTVQLWPHVHGTDAMFLALLRRS